MMKHLTVIILSTLLLQASLAIEKSSAQTEILASIDSSGRTPSSFVQPTFAFLRDTLYVLDSIYLEVRLDKQMIYQHFRDGTTRRYPCSTGNSHLPNAIATREGLFNIQWKSKRYMSRQFEVWLNYWMPFDGGIGFHGLDGHSYYRYLGRRPSSHGCVRISNETGKALFTSTPNQTLVFVHSGTPARLLKFANTTQTDLKIITDDDQELLEKRLQAVQERRAADSVLQIGLAIAAGEKNFRKIAVGRANNLAPIQYQVTPVRVPLLTRIPELRKEPSRTYQTELPAPPLANPEDSDIPR